MRQRRQDVTDTELSILEVLWDQRGATRRRVTDTLYPGGDASHYATVQKLLERLEAKGYVRHRRGGDGVLMFTATVGREELISRRLREVAERLCGGSMTPLLMNLVRAQALTGAELRDLQDLVQQLVRQHGKDEQA
jgi:predicted transcriptional regulator